MQENLRPATSGVSRISGGAMGRDFWKPEATNVAKLAMTPTPPFTSPIAAVTSRTRGS